MLVGARYGPRQHVFDAVIDKVEVKRLAELSPREIEHDNPEIRRPEEMAHFLGQLYNREVTEEDIVTVIRFSAIKPSSNSASSVRRAHACLRIGTPKSSGSRSCAPHSSQSTAKVDENGAEHDGQRWSISPPQPGTRSGSPPRAPRTSAGRRRSGGRSPSSRRAPCGAPRAASRRPYPRLAGTIARGG